MSNCAICILTDDRPNSTWEFHLVLYWDEMKAHIADNLIIDKITPTVLSLAWDVIGNGKELISLLPFEVSFCVLRLEQCAHE